MKRSRRSFVIGAGLVALGFVGGTLAGAQARKGIVRWSLTDLKWQPAPAPPVMMAEAWKAANGSYCTFHKFPKGTKLPLHHHTADLGTVIMGGQFGSAEQGQPTKLSGTGTYMFIPAGLKHTTECGGDADCVAFTCQPGAFDVVEAAAKK